MFVWATVDLVLSVAALAVSLISLRTSRTA